MPDDMVADDGITFPRVLIVGQTFNVTSGAGITLTSLFRGWPRDRLAVLTWPMAEIAPGVCDDYWVLGHDEDRFVWPLSLLPRTATQSGPVRLRGDVGPRRAGGRSLAPQAEPLARRVRRRGIEAADGIGVGDLIRRHRVSARLASWLCRYGPDVVYTQLASLNCIRLTTGVLEVADAPLVIHFMDDWPSTI